MAVESLQRKINNFIHIGNPTSFNAESFARKINNLMERAYINDPDIGKFVEKIFDIYHPVQNEDNEKIAVRPENSAVPAAIN